MLDAFGCYTTHAVHVRTPIEDALRSGSEKVSGTKYRHFTKKRFLTFSALLLSGAHHPADALGRKLL